MSTAIENQNLAPFRCQVSKKVHIRPEIAQHIKRIRRKIKIQLCDCSEEEKDFCLSVFDAENNIIEL